MSRCPCITLLNSISSKFPASAFCRRSSGRDSLSPVTTVLPPTQPLTRIAGVGKQWRSLSVYTSVFDVFWCFLINCGVFAASWGPAREYRKASLYRTGATATRRSNLEILLKTLRRLKGSAQTTGRPTSVAPIDLEAPAKDPSSLPLPDCCSASPASSLGSQRLSRCAEVIDSQLLLLCSHGLSEAEIVSSGWAVIAQRLNRHPLHVRRSLSSPTQFFSGVYRSSPTFFVRFLKPVLINDHLVLELRPLFLLQLRNLASGAIPYFQRLMRYGYDATEPPVGSCSEMIQIWALSDTVKGLLHCVAEQPRGSFSAGICRGCAARLGCILKSCWR